MPSANLSSSLKRIKSAASPAAHPYILFVGNMMPRYHYCTWDCGSPSAHQLPDYLRWQIDFLNRLAPDTLRDLIFRPTPENYGWSVRRRLEDAVPGIRLDDRGADYETRLGRAALVIHDMNETTILESLAADIPTIAFWDPRYWELRPEAEPWFQQLRDAGILFHSPSEAAEAVRKVWPDVDRWWSRASVRDARDRFTARFALSSPDWLREWADTLSPDDTRS